MAACLAAAVAVAEPPRQEVTVNREATALAAQLDRNIGTIGRTADGKLRFHGLGRIESEGAEPGSRELVLDVGDSFVIQDHHARQRFTVAAIGERSVVIEYESTFDHTTFGTELITIDRGRIELPYGP